jgi:DNA-directed RNA polymerase specialized sigma24 family protein
MGEGKVHINLRVPNGEQVLSRLAMAPRDVEALIALYEDYEAELRGTAARWFGDDGELCQQAVNSILSAIGRQAPSYDPQSMDPGKWIHECADAEARRLREALDTARNKVLGRRPT